MKALVDAFNQEKALVGAFSVVVQLPLINRFAALQTRLTLPAGWAGQHHQINVEQKCGERGQGLSTKCVELMIRVFKQPSSLIRYHKLKIKIVSVLFWLKAVTLMTSFMHGPSVRAVSCVPIKRWWLHHYRILGPSWDWRGQYFTRGTPSSAELEPDPGHGTRQTGQGASRGHLGWLQFQYSTVTSFLDQKVERCRRYLP